MMQAIKENPTASTPKTQKKSDTFIDRILENLDQVNAQDWEMHSDLSAVYPSNLFSGNQYQGYNILALYLDTMIKKFSSAKYATFNSIVKAGGRLKKGSKGCLIEFFTYIFRDKETGKTVKNETVEKMNDEEKKKIVKVPCVRNYTVFNSQQIENLDEIKNNFKEQIDEKNEILEIQNSENFISKIIKNGNLVLRYSMDEIAYYTPVSDCKSSAKSRHYIV